MRVQVKTQKPRVWVCPLCGFCQREPNGLLKGYEGVGHWCRRAQRMVNLEVKQ